MKDVEMDPLVSCPIVCGEYMRASGFFFRLDERVYLITARHNVLSTDGQKLKTGGLSSNFVSRNDYRVVDVYLRTGDEFDAKRLNLNDCDGIKHSPEIDIVAIPFDGNPDEYGYHIWTEADISDPRRSTATLDSIGFNGSSFPDPSSGYAQSIYATETGTPVTLRLENELHGTSNNINTGLVAVGIDEKFVGKKEEYNGLSGSPILGDGLVGIHSHTADLPTDAMQHYNEFRYVVYTRAEVLPHMLD